MPGWHFFSAPGKPSPISELQATFPLPPQASQAQASGLMVQSFGDLEGQDLLQPWGFSKNSLKTFESWSTAHLKGGLLTRTAGINLLGFCACESEMRMERGRLCGEQGGDGTGGSGLDSTHFILSLDHLLCGLLVPRTLVRTAVPSLPLHLLQLRFREAVQPLAPNPWEMLAGAVPPWPPLSPQAEAVGHTGPHSMRGITNPQLLCSFTRFQNHRELTPGVSSVTGRR